MDSLVWASYTGACLHSLCSSACLHRDGSWSLGRWSPRHCSGWCGMGCRLCGHGGGDGGDCWRERQKEKKKKVKSTDSHLLSLLSQCTVHNQVDMLRKIDFLRNCLCGMNTGISNCVSAHISFCFLTQHCIHADVQRNKYYMKTQVYLVGGEGGSWSGGARLKALPSNICICVRTSSMDGWELSVEESEPRWAFTPKLPFPVPVDPPP